MSAFQLVIPKNQCYNLAMNKQNPTNYSLKKFDLFSSLLSIVNDAASNSEINRIIAEYLLRNFHKLHQLTIYDVAEECFVSRSSIHRFLKQIGFDQFNSLEQYVDETQQHYKAYLEYTNHDNFADYIKKVSAISDFPLLFDAHKPSCEKTLEFMKKHGLTPEHTAIVGDRPLTDIWCGKKLGCKTILVDSITAKTENLPTRFVRKLERCCIKK